VCYLGILWTVYQLWIEMFKFMLTSAIQLRAEAEISHFVTAFWRNLWPPKPICVKWSKREAERTPASSAEVYNALGFTSTSHIHLHIVAFVPGHLYLIKLETKQIGGWQFNVCPVKTVTEATPTWLPYWYCRLHPLASAPTVEVRGTDSRQRNCC
jgi:hypothetical protein